MTSYKPPEDLAECQEMIDGIRGMLGLGPLYDFGKRPTLAERFGETYADPDVLMYGCFEDRRPSLDE